MKHMIYVTGKDIKNVGQCDYVFNYRVAWPDIMEVDIRFKALCKNMNQAGEMDKIFEKKALKRVNKLANDWDFARKSVQNN